MGTDRKLRLRSQMFDKNITKRGLVNAAKETEEVVKVFFLIILCSCYLYYTVLCYAVLYCTCIITSYPYFVIPVINIITDMDIYCTIG